MSYHDHTATDIATNPVTTTLTLLAGVLTMFTKTAEFIFGHQQEIGFILMCLVFICQLVAFGNRFRLWLFEKRDEDASKDDE